MRTNRVAIISAARSAFGKFRGILKDIELSLLGSTVIREVIYRTGIAPAAVEEVIMGTVYQAGNGPNPARVAAVKAGIPYETPSVTINKLCGSGLKSISLATQAILLGEVDCVIAGGMESMSSTPNLFSKESSELETTNLEKIDSMVKDGLWDYFYDCHMGETVENLIKRYDIPRLEQDQFSLESHERYFTAYDLGIINDEVVRSPASNRGMPVDKNLSDENPRRDTSIEALTNLQAVFLDNGTITAGNASGIADGAAAVLLMSENRMVSEGLEPMGFIKSFAVVGVDPLSMGIAPAFAIRKLLNGQGLSLSDINLIEINEAFAGQVLAVGRELKWDSNKVNVNGGSIALGHPLGASGSRVVVSLVHEMCRRDCKYGIAAACIGGGMGIATLLERF